MANIEYSVNVSTSTGIANLEKLQRSVAATSTTFDKLKGAIASLAIGSLLAQLANYADGVDDIAKANNLAIESVLGFGKALEYNGGKADAAANGIATFTANIAEAADGSAKLQDTFGRLGITLNDIATLSEQDLLNKTVTSLSNMDNASLRASLSTQLFGKALKGVDLKGFNEDFQKYTEEQRANAPAIAAAAQASENFARALGTLKTEVLVALKPVSELANAILDSGKAVKVFIEWVVGIGTVLLTFTALGKAISIIRAGIVAISAGATALAGAFAGVGTSAITLGSALAGLIKNIPILGALAVGVAFLYGQVKKGIEELFPGLVKNKKATDDSANADKSAANAAREVQAAYAKKALEIAQISENFAKANARVIDNINLENQLIGKSKVYSDVVKAQEELFKRSADEIDKLRDAKAALSAEELRAGLGAKYDEQISKIEKLTQTESSRVARAVENQNRLQAIEQFRLFGIKAEIDASNQLQTIQDDIAKSTLTSIEKKYYDIDVAARASAKSAIEAEEARRNAKMPIEEQQKYYAEARKGSAQLKAAAEEEYVNSRRFSTGWKQAFNDYAENASNAAEQAKRVFQAATQGMEDLLYKFFTTGKLGWRDFIQTVIDALIKSQIQQLVSKIMAPSVGSAGGAGGLLGGAIIPGILAGGGPAAMGTPYIVGERGPELFVPASNGTVVPNSGLGGAANVTYNISAVDAQSFKQMLARDPSFLYAVTEQGRRTLPGAA